jgi:uncharacterized protein
MNISGVYSVASSFLKRGTKTAQGAQIDMLLDRNDQIISIFEIKYYNDSFRLVRLTRRI